jgi:hypothetical protein
VEPTDLVEQLQQSPYSKSRGSEKKTKSSKAPTPPLPLFTPPPTFLLQPLLLRVCREPPSGGWLLPPACAWAERELPCRAVAATPLPKLARAALGRPSSRRGGWEGMRRTAGPNRAPAVEDDEEQDDDERHATRTHLDVESRTGRSCVGARAPRYRA